MDYETILHTARETKGVTVDDLLAMSEKTDPFYVGRGNRKEQGEWFRDTFEEYGEAGYHLRRLHYKIIGQVKNRNGSLYKNTEKDWGRLCTASTNARHLGLVGYGDIVDRRNPPPKVIAEHSSDPLYDWYMSPQERFYTYQLYPSVSYNFNYTELRSYHIEIWAEKSSMDDILVPLCQKYNVQFIGGAGYESLTHINSLLVRISQYEKPCRVFYVSDYDDAGQGMPRQVSRHLEYQIQETNSQVDVKLKPIILLKEHVKKYNLPGAPDKKETELDALEALHPGEFEKIVTSYLEKYIDLDDSSQLAQLPQLDRETEVFLNSPTTETLYL